MKKAAVWTVVMVAGLGVYGAASGQPESNQESTGMHGTSSGYGGEERTPETIPTGPLVAVRVADDVKVQEGLAVERVECEDAAPGYYDCLVFVGAPDYGVATVTVDCLNANAVNDCVWWVRQ